MVSRFGSLGYTIMGKTADLTVVQQTIIDTLHKEGKPQTFIAKETGCSQSAVSTHVNRKLSGSVREWELRTQLQVEWRLFDKTVRDEARWVARRSQADEQISKARRLRSTDPIQNSRSPRQETNRRQRTNWHEQTTIWQHAQQTRTRYRQQITHSRCDRAN